jgi:folate-dependent tRNA-U54 methylase TrmFO/GidA
MNTNFGLFPPLSNQPRDKDKKRQQIAQRALEEFDAWTRQFDVS